MKIVIIGNGPAAITAAETIRELDGACEIIMISQEDEPYYSPCPLAEYVEGSLAREDLFLRGRSFYEENRIVRLFGNPVIGIDPAARKVRLGGMFGGELAGYDRLLIATGAAPVMPPIPGLKETPGAFALKTLADADGILKRLGQARRAVVIGSGFIGLEAAQGLRRQGLQVTVVEALDQTLPQMLDSDVAELVRQRLEDYGVEVLLSCPAEAVIGGPHGVEAVRAGGLEIPCELAVCAAGVRPNLGFLSGSGVDTGRGVLVDDRMRTSQPDVYAAGDVIELKGKVHPNWPNAVSTGRVAGLNMMGADRRHVGLDGVNVVRIFDVPVASFGAIAGGVMTGDRVLQWRAGGAVRKIAVTDGKVAGAQLWGDVNGAGVYHELMKKGHDISSLEGDLPSPRFGYGRMLRQTRGAMWGGWAQQTGGRS
jgi:nitrite reductase (NADH) large subunit